MWYLAKFERGYYAENQPHLHWSFTDDPDKAKKYKTLKGCTDRLHTGKDSRNPAHVPVCIVEVKRDWSLHEIEYKHYTEDPNDPWKVWR